MLRIFSTSIVLNKIDERFEIVYYIKSRKCSG